MQTPSIAETTNEPYVCWTAPEEEKIIYLRRDRNEKLKESDIYMLPDYPITEEKRDEWRLYRHALRNITSTQSFDDIVVDNTFTLTGCEWPSEPTDATEATETTETTEAEPTDATEATETTETTETTEAEPAEAETTEAEPAEAETTP